MQPPFLLIISGLPGTGKSTLAKKIAADIHLPLIIRDEIKETLFDTLGYSDREWSKKMGGASYELLYHILEVFLKAGTSLIVESPFNSYPLIAEQKFLDIQKIYGVSIIQVVCVCEGSVLVQRFKKRAKSGDRHPGHSDEQNYEEFEAALLTGTSVPLNLQGPVITVDTTDIDRIPYDDIVHRVVSEMSQTALL